MLHPSPSKRKIISLAVLSALSTNFQALADEATPEKIVTSPVVVTATRIEQNSFDLPVAIDVVEKKDIQDGQLQMTLSESLIRVPGITAQTRTNQSQDPQISSRGFGSRSSFGVRGVRVYVDGIPLTMPDGQGQPGVVDLSAIKSIEVMRGPFSALYGNSSGGVIQMLTEDAPKTPEIDGTVMFGSYDTKRQILEAAGVTENIEYLLNTSNFETDGYRDFSAGKKQQATAKLKFNISEDTKLTTLINWFDQEAQDPIGLDRARAFSGNTREDVVPAARFANTSVKRDHTQIGFNLEHAFDSNNKITFIPYVGNRNNAQILTTTPLATTLTGPGGTSTNFCNTTRGTCARLSEIEREFYGMDARWDNKGMLAHMPYNLSFGLTYGKSTDKRLDTNILNNGFNVNVLNRDESNISRNFDQYFQARLGVTEKLDLHAGARHTKVKLAIEDNFLTGTGNNGDNSGSVEYQKTTPVIGAVWKVNPTFNLYANFGKGFETPTFIEAAFDNVATGVPSQPNLNLKPSESNNFELGAKAFIADNTQVNFNIFRITTQDEIITNQTVSGRSSFTNANDTKRTGAELSVSSEFDNNLSTFVSYSLLNAKFDSDFTNNQSPPSTIQSGNRIPGTYKTQLYGEIAWKYAPLGFSTAFEGRHNSKVYVNDTNTESAPSYTIFNIRAGLEQNLENWQFKEYLRVENLFDKEYIGSVRINDANIPFEPAAGRNYLLGLNAKYKF